jgi:uncharacterized membrane protein
MEVKEMRSKKFLVLISVIALSAIMLVSAAYLYTLSFNMSAYVAESGDIIVTYNGTDYGNATSLSLNWGTVVPGQTTNRSIIINNNVNNAVTPSLSNTGLPSGWTITLSDTSAISAKTSVTRYLILSVPNDAGAGTSSWTTVLNISS